MAVAENRLSTDLLAKPLCGGLKEIPADVFGYPGGRGMPRLRSTLAVYAQKTFMKVNIKVDKARVLLLNFVRFFQCLISAFDAA